MLDFLDRLTFVLIALLPAVGFLVTPAVSAALARRRDAAEMPPELLEVISPEDRESARVLREFAEFLDSDETPTHDRLPWPRAVVLSRARFLLPVIALLAWFVPPVGFVAAAAWAIACAYIWSGAKREFLEIDAARGALLERAFRIAKEHVRYPGGVQYVYRKWVQVEEWNHMTPKAFHVFFTETFKANERDRFAFEEQWRQALGARAAWGFNWRLDENKVICTPLPQLPTKVDLPFPFAHEYPWYEIPLGVTATGKTVKLDLRSEPHMLIAGQTSSGKSVQLNAIMLHLLQRPDWAVFIADPKDALYSYAEAEQCKRFETSMEGILDMVQQYQAENQRRKIILKENGQRKWGELPEWITIDGVRVKRPPLMMMVVEEAIDLLSESGVKEVDVMKKEIRAYLLKLAATCRSQGLHLLLVIQRPDAVTLGGQFRSQLGARIQVGAMKGTDSAMVLGESAPRSLMVVDGDDPDDPVKVIKGRAAYANSSGEFTVYQGFFSNDDDASLERYLRVCNMLTEPVEKPGGVVAPRFTPEELLGGQRLHPVADVVEEDGEVSGSWDGFPVVGGLLARLPFEVFTVRETVFDDEEGCDVERSHVMVRRRVVDDVVVDDVPGGVVVDEGRQERIRLARERIRNRRREVDEDDGVVPVSVAGAVVPAVFADPDDDDEYDDVFIEDDDAGSGVDGGGVEDDSDDDTSYTEDADDDGYGSDAVTASTVTAGPTVNDDWLSDLNETNDTNAPEAPGQTVHTPAGDWWD